MRSFTWFVSLTSLLVVSTSCNDDTGGDSGSDTTPPTVSVVFPPAQSLTQTSSITMHGTANDAGKVTVVSVNGVNATSTDDFATWQATVPLAPGNNDLVVEARDAAGNIDAQAAQISIQRNVLLTRNKTGLVLDSANNRVLVLENSLAAVVAIDITSGVHTILSGKTIPNADNPLSSPEGIVLDSTNNRALVVDNGVDGVIAVDLTSGVRTVLSDPTTPDAANVLNTPRAIILDTSNGRALVVDSSLNAVIAVDLTSGAR